MCVHIKQKLLCAFSLVGHCGNQNAYVYIHVWLTSTRNGFTGCMYIHIYTMHTASYVVVQGVIVFLQTYNVSHDSLESSTDMSRRLHIVTFVFVITLLD